MILSERNNDFEKLKKHYELNWGQKECDLLWEKGPIKDLPVGFHTEVYKKDETTNVITTSGLSFGNSSNKIELCLYYDPNFRSELRLAEILTVTAHFHLAGEALKVGDSVNWGEPIIEKSKCCWGYLSWPYLEGVKLGNIEFNGAKVFWLVPITEEELKFKKINGVDSLEQIFEEKELNYIDLLRESLC